MYHLAFLMVKDFNCHGFRTDETLMTNADTPALATADLIEATVNPFTGKAITTEGKDVLELHIFGSHEWHTDVNNGSTFLPGPWYAVHDDVRIAENWSFLGEH